MIRKGYVSVGISKTANECTSYFVRMGQVSLCHPQGEMSEGTLLGGGTIC